MSSPVPYFAVDMQKELDRNSHKPGWQNMTPGQCLRRAKQEMGELTRAVKQGKSKEDVISECADVANFVMFLSRVYEPNTEW